MKRISLFIIATVLLWTGLQAQIFTVSDTTPCFERQRNYFYYTWFDTSRWYLNSKDTLWFNHSQNECIPDWQYWLNYINETADSTRTPRLHFFGQYTSRPLKIKGLWAMVDKNPIEHDPRPILNYSRSAEYLYLYTVDSNEPYIDTVDWYYDSYFLKRINGARWDTNQPRMLCIPAYVDGHAPYNRFRDEYCPAYQYCYLYEAHFDSAVTVEGEFWIAGTYNSNIQGRYRPVWLHYPTEYLSWGSRFTCGRIKLLSGTVDGPWRRGDYDYTYELQAGPFGVITDYQWFVHAATADSAQGMALGTDYCTDSTQVTISAVPNRGFRFLHWNDGNTDNPRSILVTQDTLFTAFFEPLERYSVSTDCNFPYCFVAGDSVYYEGDTATLYAYTNVPFYAFSHWNDSVVDNPRSVVVTQDTAFTAFFVERQGIATPKSQRPAFSLTPNPAHATVTVALASPCGTDCSLSLRDASGHEVLTMTLAAGSSSATLPLRHLPAGSYFVTLSTPQGSSTQKLILQ